MSQRTISVTDARSRLPELVDDVVDQLSEYVITKRGRAHAVLLSVEEHEAMQETLEVLSDSEALRRIREGLDDLARGDVLSFEEIFGKPL
jgi:antitoxin YefM